MTSSVIIRFVCLGGFLVCLLSEVQAIDSVRLQYVKPFEHQFFVGPTLRYRATSFQFTNALNRKNWVRNIPNNSYGVGLRVTLFGIGIEGSYAVPFARRNVDRFGSSTVRDLQFNSFGSKWFADVFLQRYDGFFSRRSWFPLTSKDIHPQRDDLTLRTAGFSFTYLFNNTRFSMRAPYQFSEHQMKSAGSVLFGVALNRFRIHADGAIISDTDQSYFSSEFDAGAMSITTTALTAGYSYTLVHRHYFVNLTGLVGPAHHWMQYERNANSHHDIDLNVFASYAVAAGFNGNRNFIGVTYQSKNSQRRLLDTSVSNSFNTFRIVAGVRFREKGFMTFRLQNAKRLIKK